MKKLLLIISVVCAIVGCKNDDADVRPGLWSEQEMIETFWGDTVRVTGQASNKVGLDRVEISCEAWNIYKVYNLRGEHSVVFNYDYRFVVPVGAQFNQNLLIKVVDTEGTESKRTILMTNIPDNDAPMLSKQMLSKIYAEIPSSGGATSLNLGFTDNQMLKSTTVKVTDVTSGDEVINTVVPLSGKSMKIKQPVSLSHHGTYNVAVSVEDVTGNSRDYTTQLEATAQLSTKTADDYKQIYLVKDGENENDYLSGFYRYVVRQESNLYGSQWDGLRQRYSGFVVYAPEDNTKIYFLSAPSMESDKMGAASIVPALAGQLVVGNNAQPITIPTAGYYSLVVDLEANAYSLQAFTPSASAFSGDMMVTGDGFVNGTWELNNQFMKKITSYRGKSDMIIKGGYTGEWGNSYCISDGTWNYMFRYSESSDYGPMWWGTDDLSANGSASFGQQDEETRVEIVFDAIEMWSTMKKVYRGDTSVSDWKFYVDKGTYPSYDFVASGENPDVFVLNDFAVTANLIDQWGGTNFLVVSSNWALKYTYGSSYQKDKDNGTDAVNSAGTYIMVPQSANYYPWTAYATAFKVGNKYRLTFNRKTLSLNIEATYEPVQDWYMTGEFNGWKLNTENKLTAQCEGSKLYELHFTPKESDFKNGTINFIFVKDKWVLKYSYKGDLTELNKEYQLVKRTGDGSINCKCMTAGKNYKLTLNVETYTLKIEEE